MDSRFYQIADAAVRSRGRHAVLSQTSVTVPRAGPAGLIGVSLGLPGNNAKGRAKRPFGSRGGSRADRPGRRRDQR
ncbi:MAG TPA: hypothetical protein DDZ76_05720 [Xanthomonadales bacterium]|nr:hypothetical protein [Xanthomonadales bacterium]